jgi:hypothetical protein
MWSNQLKNDTFNMKKCKCGEDARKNKSDCLACHRIDSKSRRAAQKAAFEGAMAKIDDGIFHRDPITIQHFQMRINTFCVVVLKEPSASNYTGIPIGFLPEDQVMVWQKGNIIEIVKLDQLANSHGTKRRQALYADQ